MRYGTGWTWICGRGELVAVLGANGSGKSSLVKVILGRLPLRSGTVEFAGQPAAGRNRRDGTCLPSAARLMRRPLRGQDLDRARCGRAPVVGIPWPRRARRTAVADLVASVHAESTARAPISRLSGGEQQRLRVAALAGNPAPLLCDEPLLSLDLAHQRLICDLVDRARREDARGVVFVTHDINPLLGVVDRVLYLAGGRFRIGTRTRCCAPRCSPSLYGSPGRGIRSQDRILVAGVLDHPHHTTEPEV